jgi:uncharacterized membrane protein
MTTHRFSNSDALRFGWNSTRAHLAPLLVLGGSGLMLAMLSQAFGRNGGAGAMLGLLVQFAQVALTLVTLRVALKIFDGEPFDLAQPAPLFEGYWRFLFASFLFGLVVSLGFVLLIVPGVLLGLAFCFAPLFAAEGQRDLVEAFRSSSRLTRGVRWQLFGFAWVLLGVNLLGALALGVGVVVTVPMTMVCTIYAYRRLQGKTEAATPHAPSLTARPIS